MDISRETIMEAVARWFCVEPNEDGSYDINSCDWEAGSSQGSLDKPWISLKNFVLCMEDFLSEVDPYDYIDE